MDRNLVYANNLSRVKDWDDAKRVAISVAAKTLLSRYDVDIKVGTEEFERLCDTIFGLTDTDDPVDDGPSIWNLTVVVVLLLHNKRFTFDRIINSSQNDDQEVLRAIFDNAASGECGLSEN